MHTLWDLVSLQQEVMEAYTESREQPPARQRWAWAELYLLVLRRKHLLIPGWCDHCCEKVDFCVNHLASVYCCSSLEKHWDGSAFSIMPNDKCFSTVLFTMFCFAYLHFQSTYVQPGDTIKVAPQFSLPDYASLHIIVVLAFSIRILRKHGYSTHNDKMWSSTKLIKKQRADL